ncbi:MAG: DsbA family protein [Acidobacteriota bacterium]|nr:DsbA family protein [Acidobacteriota bacterium]
MNRPLRVFPPALLILVSCAALFAQNAPKTSFRDKPTLEAYVRHLFVWPAAIQITVSDPKPSALPGFDEVSVHAAQGQASQDELFYVSKDGRKIVRGVVFDVAQNPFKPDLDKIKTDSQPSFGTAGAPVVIVEFSDFECSYCREEAKMLRTNLLSAYPKQVRLYYKDYPLEQIHPWSKPAAIAGRCIFQQNPVAFWDYHDWIFENQKDVTAENLKSKILDFGKDKKLDALQLTRCMDTKATASEVEKSMAEGRDLNVASTPTLFVNGRRMVGSTAWPDLRRVIDYEIDYQKTAKNAGEDCGCEVTLPTVPGSSQTPLK